MYYATAQEMEQLDILAVEKGLNIIQMMELAGWHMISLFKKLNISKEKKICVVVGKGNKGGDGLSAVRHLLNYGYTVSVVLMDENIKLDSLHHLTLLEKMNIPIYDFGNHANVISSADVVIDALLGYHIIGVPRDNFSFAIDEIEKSGAYIIAYDIPSGIHPDTGECLENCIHADVTLSLALAKKCFDTEYGRKKVELFIL